MEVNVSCLDNLYPVINEFVDAGVTGGIPNSLPVVVTINPSYNIQTVIDSVNTSGGGVILFSSGVYSISSTISMKDNVVLRGVDATTVIIESTITSTWAQGKKNTLEFDNTSNSGVEDLTIFYKVVGFDPIDRLDWLDGTWCNNCFQNNPHGLTDLYVRQIAINSNSSNCWVDGCRILNSGTDPILLAGNYNTLRNNFIDRCYNKGGDGNGYYDIRGDHNLITNDTVKRIRHFAIQLGAEHNVIINCFIEGDVNFHNGDGGSNLLENNEINLPTWHGWDIFGTGAAIYGHQTPGPNNIMVNNITNFKNLGPKYADTNVIYTFTDYGQPDTTNWSMPICNTFYPMYSSTANIEESILKSNMLIYPNPAENTFTLQGSIDLSEEAISVYNSLGQEMRFTQKQIDLNNIEIDISDLNPGLYIVKIKSFSKKIYKR